MALADGPVCATIAVRDMAVAKKFYGDALGLSVEDENFGGILFGSGGGSKLFVYESQFASTNKATYASWKVEDVDGTVAELKAKGVEFQTYPDMPQTTWEGEVAVMGDMKSAWFTDPDGNIFALSNM